LACHRGIHWLFASLHFHHHLDKPQQACVDFQLCRSDSNRNIAIALYIDHTVKTRTFQRKGHQVRYTQWNCHSFYVKLYSVQFHDWRFHHWLFRHRFFRRNGRSLNSFVVINVDFKLRSIGQRKLYWRFSLATL
jgi:hypothetical protein